MVEGHMKQFTVHSLRDARATELLSKGFDGVDLGIFGGWAMQRLVTGVTAVMSRYIDIYKQWGIPFPKLMKTRRAPVAMTSPQA